MKFDVLFSDDQFARHLRRSVVETCGVGRFHELLRLVDDVLSSVPDGTDVAPIFAFGESIQEDLGAVHECPELPFDNFFEQAKSS